MEINSPKNDKKCAGLGGCCSRAWLLPAGQLLLILKLWFNVIYFLFDTVLVPVFHLSNKLNRKPIPCTGARVPVHRTAHARPLFSKMINDSALMHF